MDFKKAVIRLAELTHNCNEKKRRRLKVPFRTIARIKSGTGNPTLRSITDAGRVCGFEVDFKEEMGGNDPVS